MELVGGEKEVYTSGRSLTRLPIPFNSKHLTLAHLKRIAAALDLPTTAASEEVRQMVEGKLADLGQQPLNVQVILGTTPPDVFQVQDANEIFLREEAEVEKVEEEPVDDYQSNSSF